LSTSAIFTTKRELSNICGNDSLKLEKRIILTGHTAEVVDISFNKFSTD
jgi:predicted nucleic-acid-binding Zn-ribbon protein